MKNKIYYIIAVPVLILLLFLVVVYRSDGKKNNGTIVINIALDKDNLTNEQKDSLLTELLDLYDGMGTNTYHSVDLIIRGNTEKKVLIPKSIINSIRLAFSNSFYTYDNRMIDIQKFKSNYNQKSDSYRNDLDYKGNINDNKAEIIFFGNTDNPNSNEANSIAMIKSRIIDCLKSRKTSKIIISNLVNSGGNGTTGIVRPPEEEPKPEPYNGGGLKPKIVEAPKVEETTLKDTGIKFSLDGNVNVFRFTNSAVGVTYNYEIKCESNCIDDDYSLTGSTQNSLLELDLHSEYEAIKLRTFKIIVTSTLGNQTKVNVLSGIKLKCKK
jgi:hypothetical protein